MLDPNNCEKTIDDLLTNTTDTRSTSTSAKSITSSVDLASVS